MDMHQKEIHAEACSQPLDYKTGHDPRVIAIMEILLSALRTSEFEKFCDNTPDGVALWRAYERFALSHPNCHILDFARSILSGLPADEF